MNKKNNNKYIYIKELFKKAKLVHLIILLVEFAPLGGVSKWPLKLNFLPPHFANPIPCVHNVQYKLYNSLVP